ncbi:DUF5131 family protein [Dysgonomonas sp.]|jgi:DNA repair photolyase|uniref:DUF5131 family protein n=1 Tax=Dysgonomonas sp. TaxID=1891233 RepID=UPI002D1FBF7B|nr:DUF5131 family protein [Dysgonomonas sp.]
MKNQISNSTESINTVNNNLSENQQKSIQKELKPIKGNMYDFITHTWNPIKGKCEHECGYCYVSKLVKNQKPIRLDDKAMKADLGTGNFIFVGSGTDVFANNVPSEWITEVLDYCDKFDNKYLFQSKNPERFMDFIKHPVFKKSVICTTIESNRPYVDCKAPSVEDRVSALEIIKSKYPAIETYVTIEPIMDFDLKEMIDLIKRCEPIQINIGADSKRTGLTEPSKEKIEELIVELKKFTNVDKKKNLKRLMKSAENLEIEQAKKTVSTSLVMKVQIMEKTENGYTIKEENRKFGLVKENRPIKDSDVNGFLQIIREGKYKESFPIIAVEVIDIIDNYNIVDLEGNPISKVEASEYLIVIDGQHRITAFSKLNAIRNQSDQITVPNVRIEKGITNIREYLADINMVGHSWNNADKLCVSAISTGSKLLAKVNELIKADYTATTAVLICTGKRLTPKQLKELIITGKTDQLPDEEKALVKANKFLTITTAILGNDMKLLRKRYFINGFISAAKFFDEQKVFDALGKLILDDFKTTKEDSDFEEKLGKILNPNK